MTFHGLAYLVRHPVPTILDLVFSCLRRIDEFASCLFRKMPRRLVFNRSQVLLIIGFIEVTRSIGTLLFQCDCLHSALPLP